MKRSTRMLYVMALAFMMSMSCSSLLADEPPNPGGGPGSGDLPVGGGAPLGGGWIITLVMAGAYSVKKTYRFTRQR